MKPSYSGGACRIPLVGRQDFLRAVERRICWGGVHLLYVEAQGGMGKTALLEAMLERNRPDRETDLRFEWCVAREVIDFRHTDLHSPEGLIRRIIQVTGEWCFGETLRALQALDQTRNGNGGRAPGKSEGALEAAFLSEYSALAERGVVLAFDTVEELTWACSRGDVQAGSSSPILSAGEWLLHTVFPALQGNAVILLAGRPSSIGQLLQGVREQNPLVEIQHIPLTAYTADETREYLRTVTQVEASCGNPNAAARLMAFCQAQGDTAHFLTGGKPLLLALVTELVARGWNLPAPFGRSLDELRQRGAEEWWPETEQALAVQLLDSPNRMGDILRALAWLPKGATPELLARVMELKTSDGQWDVYAAAEYLDQVAELRLVQVRAEDRRVFLHDELQALLERHIHHERGQEDREKVCAAIRTYYRNRAHDLERRLERLPTMSSLVKRRLGQVWVEEMYYCLRHCPPTGAAMYFWLAEEALSRRDSEMDLLLHAELMRTIRWMKARNSLEGLCPGEVEMEVGLRLGLRKLFLEGDAEGALEHLDRLQSGWGENTAPMALEGVHLHLCQARARIQRAQAEDWDTARGLLQGVEQAADEMLRLLPDTPLREGHRWQVQMLKALALQGEGRLAARQGRHLAAVQHYQAAAMLERRLEMSGLTRTLIELAHAMAHTGQVHHARLLAQEAERRGRRSGDAEALARAFNARAIVEESDNHLRDALGYASRALQAARPIHEESIQGAIHITCARVRRRLWSSLAERDPSQGSNLLLEALKEVDVALNLLWQYPADKLSALLERACIHREIARWHDGKGQVDEAHQAATRSHRDAEGAVRLAQALDLPGQQALAWVHVGWLHYHLGQSEQVRAALQEATVSIPSGYLLPPDGCAGLLTQAACKEDTDVLCWLALGQAERLRVYLALDQFAALPAQEEKEQNLRAAVRHSTLSLHYLEQIAAEHPELTRTEERLHRRILQSGLPAGDLHRRAREVAIECHLAQPTRLQGFLDRVFGPADLWGVRRNGVQLRMPLFADLPEAPELKLTAEPSQSAVPTAGRD